MPPLKFDSLKLSFLKLQPDFSDVVLYTYGHRNHNLYKYIHAWRRNFYRDIHENSARARKCFIFQIFHYGQKLNDTSI